MTTDWLARVRAAENAGDHLLAYDLAERGLVETPADSALQHRAALALARIGATEQATLLVRALLANVPDDEEAASLDARLAKDVALRATPDQRVESLRLAAVKYAAIASRPGATHYPAINAATLWLLAGDRERAAELATQARALCLAGPRDYWSLATEGEAALILGDLPAVASALGAARKAFEGNFTALASTRKQLLLICAHLGLDDRLLAPLQPPGVIHFVGHRIDDPGEARRFPATEEASISQQIEALLEEHQVGFGVGSLASGADILFAEALLRRGAHLQVVLPSLPQRFIETSVASGGSEWVRRFEKCLASTSAPLIVSEEGELDDDAMYAYAAKLAMGLALIRARFFGAPVCQLGVWDGRPARGVAGSAADIATWRASGRPQRLITLPTTMAAPAPADRPGSAARRELCALIFGDVKGFSKLQDRQIPAFFEGVMGPLAKVLDRFAGHVRWRNTWGDGLYLVLDDVRAAADCALALQASLSTLNFAAMGLPASLGLRLGAHLGPVFETHDPILNRMVPCGSHVTRTARIEPITPVGSVYVTESFAAALALADDQRVCEYVGVVPLAKEAGQLRMYWLR